MIKLIQIHSLLLFVFFIWPIKLISQNLCPDSRHPHTIDLGIGVKWACCNVGASAPWEYGGYYAWGETDQKNVYSMTSYKYHTYLGSDIAGTSYDVASMKWGRNWCMPQQDDFELLLNKCKWTWTKMNGKNGYKITGPNGKSIFLPAAGYGGYTGYIRIESAGECGYYWSSTQKSGSPYSAYSLAFSNSNKSSSGRGRESGRSIRPVAY